MKKFPILCLAVSSMFLSCKNSDTDKSVTADEKVVAAAEGTSFTIDSTASTLKWIGYHKGGLNPRFGTLKSAGTFSVANGNITAGSITVDIKSILTDAKSVDPSISGGKTSADLDAHLKNADFFEVDKYPQSKFEITDVKPFDAATDKSNLEGATHKISGNLTLKDKTVNVTFPAKVLISGNGLTLDSKFSIDRQHWGLTYGTEGDAKDWMISKEVDLEFHIQAKQ